MPAVASGCSNGAEICITVASGPGEGSTTCTGKGSGAAEAVPALGPGAVSLRSRPCPGPACDERLIALPKRSIASSTCCSAPFDERPFTVWILRTMVAS